VKDLNINKNNIHHLNGLFTDIKKLYSALARILSRKANISLKEIRYHE
jgi:hypothetical protein